MNSDAGIWLLGAVGVVFVLWLAYKLLVVTAVLAAALTVRFTVFAMELPFLLLLLMFVLFPPTLIVYLVGLFLINHFDTKASESKVVDTNHAESTPLEHEQTESVMKDGKVS